jgi:hypothetical protein
VLVSLRVSRGDCGKADTQTFSGVREITFDKFDEECVAGSKDNAVIMMLYVPLSAACDKMEECLATLSKRHQMVKFVKMLATQGVKDFPPSDAPTVMTYLAGKRIKQFVKLDAFAGMQTTPDVIEWDFAQWGLVKTDLENDPRPSFSMRVDDRRERQKFIGRGQGYDRRGRERGIDYESEGESDDSAAIADELDNLDVTDDDE